MSGKKVKETGVKPIAKIVDVTAAALDPEIMGYGPVVATNKILDRNNWTIDDLDLVELNEAFAAQAVACIRDLKLDPAKVNINGGAIALGHPLGCTGSKTDRDSDKQFKENRREAWSCNTLHRRWTVDGYTDRNGVGRKINNLYLENYMV